MSSRNRDETALPCRSVEPRGPAWQVDPPEQRLRSKRLPCGRVEVTDKIALHPVLEKFIDRRGDRKTHPRARRAVKAPECIPIEGRPFQRFERVRGRVAEGIEDLTAHFTERIIAPIWRCSQLLEQIRSQEVIRSHPAKLNKEARIDPLRFVKLSKQRQNIASKRRLPRLL